MSFAYYITKALSFVLPSQTTVVKPWTEDYLIIYFNKCLIMDQDITDFALLSHGKLDQRQLQDLIIYLRAYLHNIGERYEPSDIQQVLNAIPKVWNIHSTGFASESALRAWCKEENPSTSEDDVNTFVKWVKEMDKKSEDWAYLSMSLLKFRFIRVFRKRHAEDFFDYTNKIMDDFASSGQSSS